MIIIHPFNKAGPRNLHTSIKHKSQMPRRQFLSWVEDFCCVAHPQQSDKTAALHWRTLAQISFKSDQPLLHTSCHHGIKRDLFTTAYFQRRQCKTWYIRVWVSVFVVQAKADEISDGAGKHVDSPVAPISLQVDWKKTYFILFHGGCSVSFFVLKCFEKNLPSLTIARWVAISNYLPFLRPIPCSPPTHPMPWHLPTSDMMSNAAGE